MRRFKWKLFYGFIAVFMAVSVIGQATFKETKNQRDTRMRWWRNARFGMFVHWGLYSGLAGTWKGKQVGKRGGMEWIQQRVKADTWEYAHEAAPLFRPKKGFADAWAELAKEAGCGYVVFTTKHHDGFDLFDSKYTTYDAKDWTGRDLCREIVEALRKRNLKVGFYHSVIDWHHPQYDYVKAKRLPYPLKGKPSPNGPRSHKIYLDYLHHQVRELMSNYGKVDIIWWDYSLRGAEGEFWKADALLKTVRELQPGIISNNRLYSMPPMHSKDQSDRLKMWNPEHGDFTTPEQKIPSTGIPGVDWETCMTMNTTWGYSEHDHAWKSSDKLIKNLVDIVSKGGNFLLNIGPKGDGAVPEESIKIMKDIGRWMKVNGEAVRGTQASPFKAPEWGVYTRKTGMIYAHIINWPAAGSITIPLKRSEITRVFLLADRNTQLSLKAEGDSTVIALPSNPPDKPVSVVAVALKN